MAWKVVLYISNLASICSLALILLSPTRWFVMTGWRTSLSLQPSVQLLPFDQTRLECGSSSAYTHQFPALCFKHVWIMVLCLGTNICLLKHVLILVPCCVQAPVSTRVSNTFGLRFLVCAHGCPCTHIRLQPCSNTVCLWWLVCLPSRPHQKEVTPELETILQD